MGDQGPEPEEEKTRREELQELLETITDHVYFQPPPSFQMTYPCIVYELNDIKTKYADNVPYDWRKQYKLTVIDRNPDNTIIDSVVSLAECRYDRHYVVDNLNHDVFVIYF